MARPHKVKTMSFASPDEDRAFAIQVAPLIDIVFLLICFYLLVAQLIGSQKDPSVQLASMSDQVLAAEAPAELVINLRDDGTVTVGGRPVRMSGLRALLADEKSNAAQAGQRFSVVVRADRRQRYGKLDEVLRLCRQAGVGKLIFRAAGKDRP